MRIQESGERIRIFRPIRSGEDVTLTYVDPTPDLDDFERRNVIRYRWGGVGGNPGYDAQHATMGLTHPKTSDVTMRAESRGCAPHAERRTASQSTPPPSDFLPPVRGGPPSDTAVSASAQRFAPWRAVARSALRLFATLRVLEDVADSIWNLRADIRGWRLLRDGLDRQIQQHYERSRTARSQKPGADDVREWWPIC